MGRVMVVNWHVQPQALIFFDDEFVLAETTNRMGPAWAFL